MKNRETMVGSMGGGSVSPTERWLLSTCAALLCVCWLSTALAAQFDEFSWTFKGEPTKGSAVGPTSMLVIGSDSSTGSCAILDSYFETQTPIALRVRVGVSFQNLDMFTHKIFDAPAYWVDDTMFLAPEPYSFAGWETGEYVLDFVVPPGETFGLGVWSADCSCGPGIALFHDLTIDVVPVWSIHSKIDPQVRWSRSGSNSLFASALGLAGDLNGDGTTDIAVGSLGTASAPSGGMTVISGSDGSQLLTATHPDSSFGTAIAGIGDVTGDGVLDILVGAPSEPGTAGAGSTGVAYAISGVDGSVVYSVSTETPSYRFGKTVASSPDIDGDGVPDLLIGSRTSMNLVASVRVVSGATGQTIRDLPAPVATAVMGFDMVAPADLNGDGWVDHVIGAPDKSKTAPSFVLAYSGFDGALLWSTTAAGRMGRALAVMPDQDGDGLPDLLVGAPATQVAGLDVGAVHLLSGATGNMLGSWFGPQDGDKVGHSLVVAGDVDGDALLDVVVSSQLSGFAYVVSWPTGNVLRTVPLGFGGPAGLLAAPGDLGDDGLADIVTGGGGKAVALHGLQAARSAPSLRATQLPQPGALFDVSVMNGLPLKPGFVVLGTSATWQLFLGGLLVPSPDVLLPFVLDANGAVTVTGRWPNDAGAGFSIYLQAWLADTYGPARFTSTDTTVLAVLSP